MSGIAFISLFLFLAEHISVMDQWQLCNASSWPPDMRSVWVWQSPKYFIFKNCNIWYIRATLSVLLLPHSCYHLWKSPLEISEANASQDKPEVFRSLILEPDALLIYYWRVKVHHVTGKRLLLPGLFIQRWWQRISYWLFAFLGFIIKQPDTGEALRTCEWLQLLHRDQ